MLTTNSVKTKSRHYSKQENQHKKMSLQKNGKKNKKCQKLIKLVLLWRPCKIKQGEFNKQNMNWQIQQDFSVCWSYG